LKYLLAPCAAVLSVIMVPTAAEAAGITYDCDTAANHFSELVLPAPSGGFTVTGNVQLNSLAGSTTYIPIARIRISSSTSPGQSPDHFAGVSVGALPVDASKTPSGSPAIEMVSFNVNGKDDEVLPLSMLAKPGGVQPFRLSYDGATVSATIGGESRAFAVKASDPVLRIMCSTGEFLFTDVSIQASR